MPAEASAISPRRDRRKAWDEATGLRPATRALLQDDPADRQCQRQRLQFHARGRWESFQPKACRASKYDAVAARLGLGEARDRRGETALPRGAGCKADVRFQCLSRVVAGARLPPAPSEEGLCPARQVRSSTPALSSLVITEGWWRTLDPPSRRGNVATRNLANVTRGAEPKDGIEPSTFSLPRRCSTTELLGPAE
jgi:hypothetical protein